jgi:hypothetical protein
LVAGDELVIADEYAAMNCGIAVNVANSTPVSGFSTFIVS